ncbi:MAG: carbohydrate ABC transporter permease [Clostridia bacterium]|nr:carbohydrate ABC transporter permease [Clostridia bacterium]
MKKNLGAIEKKQRLSAFGIIATVLLAIYAVSLLFPIIWAMYSSFLGRLDFKANPIFPYPEIQGYQPGNFVQAFQELHVGIRTAKGGTRSVYFFEMILYSVIWSVGSSVVMELSRCMCAYVVAKFRHHRWTRYVHSLVLILMIVAFPSNLATTIEFNKMVGTYNNLLFRVVGSVTFTGAHFLYFYAAFKNLSWEYAEAAYIDGANHYVVMWKIMMPLVKTTFFALVLLDFIVAWNDYSTSMVYMPSYPTVAYGLFKMQSLGGKFGSSVPLRLASCTVVIIPTLIVFIVFKDKLMGNLSLGGLKG